LGWLGLYAVRGLSIARQDYSTGIGYMASVWRDSPAMARLRQLPADVPIISNETTAVTFLTGRPAYALQEIYQDQPQTPFRVYGSGADAAQAAFRQKGAALVLFNTTLHEDFAMYGDQVDERLAALTDGLYCDYQGEDGAIYFYKAPDGAKP
jgi:hypothetical protein